nr:PREDICTED: claw keratin [Anolis carolinensis]XP_016852281.1 PREDICTED: claw keratin [Anolis carolinensis]|eukprot:XP_003226382.1 PREDICTED: claw keratin [Anolis carolinensis]
MANCGPSSAVPSCEAAPVVGFGSGGSRNFGRGFGYGIGYGIGSGIGFGSGIGSGYGLGGNIESAANLGILSGVQPSCINQLPPIEVVIKPAPVAVTVPGAIMSATPEPVEVGGYAPCAVGGVGIGGSGLGSGLSSGLGSGFYGGNLGGRLGGNYGLLRGRGNNCGPCV